jgi:hypothetical protein
MTEDVVRRGDQPRVTESQPTLARAHPTATRERQVEVLRVWEISIEKMGGRQNSR